MSDKDTGHQLQERIARLEQLDLDGNHPVLDFLNTVDWRDTPRERDNLHDYLDLLAWAHRVGLASREEIDRRAVRTTTDEAETAAAFTRAVAIRELVCRIVRTHTGTASADEADWRNFNQLLRDAFGRCRLVPAGGDTCCRWEFESTPDDLLWFLPELLKAAADLLVTPDDGRIKQCATEECGWFYFDTSKNNGRRWCSPGCGNRTRVKRSYWKKKGQ